MTMTVLRSETDKRLDQPTKLRTSNSSSQESA